MATWIDLVKRFLPGADDELADFILWEMTPYPCASVLQVARCLKRIKREKERSLRKSPPAEEGGDAQ